ncbi:MAG: hypothetical protein AB7S26_15850 [Sandaracinaceae bacterium]
MPRRAWPLVVGWCGFAGGLIALALYAALTRELDARVFLAAAVCGGLSAVSVDLGRRNAPEQPALGALSYSVLAAMTCPVLTGLVVLPFEARSTTAGEALGVLVVLALVGQAVAIPLGFGLGLIYAGAVRVGVALEDRATQGSVDVLVALLSVATVGVGATVALTYASGHHARDEAMTSLGVGVVAIGVLGATFGVARLAVRRALVRRAAEGELTGWAVRDADELDVPDELPRLFPIGTASRVLVTTDAHAAGPFRTRDAEVPVAWV